MPEAAQNLGVGMNEKSAISSIIVALNAHKGSVLSTKLSSREVEGGVKYHAPDVIGVEISVWDQYGKNAMRQAGACFLGAETGSRHG